MSTKAQELAESIVATLQKNSDGVEWGDADEIQDAVELIAVPLRAHLAERDQRERELVGHLGWALENVHISISATVAEKQSWIIAHNAATAAFALLSRNAMNPKEGGR